MLFVCRVAGLLEQVAAVSLFKSSVITVGVNGSEKVIQKAAIDLAVTRTALTKVLLDELVQIPNVELITGATVVGISRPAAKHLLEVQLDSGRRLLTSHVVGADGKRSCVRQAAKSLSIIEGRPNSFTWEEREENSWGVYIEVPATMPLPTAAHLMQLLHLESVSRVSRGTCL